MTRIVILSYGLQRRTRDVLDRARRYGHPIHLVPAIPLATRGLRRHRSSLVTVHDQVGRTGLDEAFGPPGELVLLLHEDVLLAPEGAAALLNAAENHDTLVVPLTNHADVDNAAGELPPDVVQPVGEAEQPLEVRRFRSVCLAASSDRLRRLLRHRLSAATTRLNVGEDAALQLPHVVATHLDEGRDQLEEPIGPDGRPLLVAAMIVKDEEEFLPGCLASLDGIVERVVVCDTGSSDRTVEIARDAGAVVIEAPWRDDFAWARNQALEHCRDAWWVLHVDADERIRVEDPEELRRFLATALPDRDGFDVPLQDIASDGSRLGGQQLPRLFPGEGTSYVGRVHEVPRYEDGSLLPWTITELLEIEHLGYQTEVVVARDKHARNLALARSDYEEEATPLAMLQLARSLKLEPETLDELLELLVQLRDMILDGTDGLNEVGHIPVYQLYSQALMLRDEPDRAWEIIREGYERYPHSPLLRTILAQIGLATNRYDEIAELGTVPEGEADRPWRNPVADAATRVQVALSRLAVDDVDGAGTAIEELLADGVPPTLRQWGEIVSIVALTRPERAVELLLPSAVADGTGDALRAVAATFDPDDAARFSQEVIASTTDPTPDQVEAALETAGAASNVEAIEGIARSADVPLSALSETLWGAEPEVAQWLRTHALEGAAAAGEQEVADAFAQLGRLDAPRVDDDVVRAAAAVLARDVTGQSLPRLGRELPIAVAAPAAVATVLAGPAVGADVRAALALCTLADHGSAAAELGDHLQRVDRDVLTTLLERAEQRGAGSMAPVLRDAIATRADA